MTHPLPREAVARVASKHPALSLPSEIATRVVRARVVPFSFARVLVVGIVIFVGFVFCAVAMGGA